MNEVINNQYTILKKLGEGGMGSVYLAEDILLQRRVAIKSLNKPKSDATAGLEDRFQQEALALARLNHPNITHVYTFVQYQGTHWMVMEYVEGNTLEDWIRQHGTISISLACSITSEILNGLHHAHYKGIIHRDLKPANIMISNEGEVKIMDFGIARIRNSQRLTQHGKSVGTLEYMAPEQIRGKEGDELTDVYAAGNMLYEMLCGETPFKTDTDYQLMKAKLEQKAPLLPQLISRTNTALQRVISKSLERDPEKRYRDVLTFRDELKKAANMHFLTGRELYNALQRNEEEIPGGSPGEATVNFSLLQKLLAAPASFSSSVISKLQNTINKRKITGGRNLWVRGRMDKSVKLLIGVVVVCIGLITWNLTRQGQQSNQPALPEPKVNYSVNLEENYAPESANSNIIEQQLIENRGMQNINGNSQPEEEKQEAPPPTNTPREKPAESPKAAPGNSKRAATPSETPSDDGKSGPVDEKPVKEEKTANTPPSTVNAIVAPRGMEIKLVLQDELSSEEKSRDGRPVRLTCAEDIKVNGQVVIPQGAIATGKIVDVVPSAKRRKGLVGFIIIRVVARDGGDIRLASERFRLKSDKDNEPAIFHRGKIFTAKIHKERLVR